MFPDNTALGVHRPRTCPGNACLIRSTGCGTLSIREAGFWPASKSKITPTDDVCVRTDDPNTAGTAAWLYLTANAYSGSGRWVSAYEVISDPFNWNENLMCWSSACTTLTVIATTRLTSLDMGPRHQRV